MTGDDRAETSMASREFADRPVVPTRRAAVCLRANAAVCKGDAYEDYRKLLLNGIVWAAGLEVPAGGVQSTVRAPSAPSAAAGTTAPTTSRP